MEITTARSIVSWSPLFMNALTASLLTEICRKDSCNLIIKQTKRVQEWFSKFSRGTSIMHVERRESEDALVAVVWLRETHRIKEK